MILKETLTESVEKAVDSAGNGAEIQIAMASDIGQDGGFGEQWLVATEQEVMVFSPDGDEASLTQTLAVQDLQEVKTQSLVGCGALEATTGGGELVEILRYSNAYTVKFSAAAKWLNQTVKGEEPTPVTEEGPSRCAKCGMLLAEGSKACPRCVQRRKVLVRLLAYLKPHWPVTCAIGVMMLAGTGVGLVPPYLTKVLIDRVLVSNRFDLLGRIVLGLAGLGLASMGLRAGRGRIAAGLGSRITHDIRGQLYEMVQRMALRFFDKHKTGELMSRVGRDTRQLQDFLAFEIPFFVTNFLMLVGIGAALVRMDWKLALIMLVPAPLVALGTAAFWNRIRYAFRKSWHLWSRLSSVLNDALSGIRVVKGFAQEPREVERFRVRSYALYRASAQAEQTWATLMPLVSFLWGTGTLVIWYLGGRAVMGGEMTLGTLMAAQAYVAMFYGPLHMVTQAWTWMTRAFAAAERVFEMLDMEPEVPDEAEAVPMPQIEGRVQLQNVTFGYDKYNPVLHDIDLDVQAGETIGFVGHSGAGKTTITNLILRFYTVDEGRILIDGVDINKIKLDDLRRQIGIVLQEPFLFDGSVAENIGYAKPGATREEIMEAAKVANAHDFICGFPDGYDTIVGERGQKLSGGERQRVSIARAILRDPRILIMDEATSLVDTETELKIQDAISRLIKGRTTFAIAHRMATLRNANRLMVLEKGKRVEMGTHDELMEEKGTYHNLVELQTKQSQIKAVDG
jgi:ATP-binding cassette subfamily B protein